MNFGSVVKISGLSFYHRGRLRNLTDRKTLHSVQGWQIEKIDISSWYLNSRVEGYPVKKMCLSPSPSCDNRVWFYADKVDPKIVYLFLWFGNTFNRPHPDAIYSTARENLDRLLNSLEA